MQPSKPDNSFQLPLWSILIIVVAVAAMLAIANSVSPFATQNVMNICLFSIALGVAMLLLFRGATKRDDDSPEVVASLPDEMSAGAIVGLLESHGIKSTATGGFTSGFQTEIAGDVKVVVAYKDAEEAKAIIVESSE